MKSKRYKLQKAMSDVAFHCNLITLTLPQFLNHLLLKSKTVLLVENKQKKLYRVE